jgi:hypothetical protein
VTVFSANPLARPVQPRDAVARLLLTLPIVFHQDPKEFVRQNSSSEFYGKLSAAGERTYATPPPLVGRDQSSFLPEDGRVFLADCF